MQNLYRRVQLESTYKRLISIRFLLQTFYSLLHFSILIVAYIWVATIETSPLLAFEQPPLQHPCIPIVACIRTKTIASSKHVPYCLHLNNNCCSILHISRCLHTNNNCCSIFAYPLLPHPYCNHLV